MKDTKQEKQNGETKKYDVFVSYRRERLETARSLVQALEKRGLRVFFDLEELDDGDFNEELYDAIDQSKNAIFLMTEGALDGCAREGDWVRNELEHVLQKEIKLILVNPSDVTVSFPGTLPQSLQKIKKIQVTKLDLGTLFNDSVNKIIKRLEGVRLAGQRADDALPVLGKAVDEVSLTGLTGQDAKHFKKALGYYNVFRNRSALAEFKKIEEQCNAFVRYYVLLLGYILDGTVEDSDFEEACCAARDLGCTDAMRLFADRYLPNDAESFDIVPPSECIQWLKKAIANGNADALSDLGAAYENARGVEKNLTTARELYKRSCEAGSLVGQVAYGQDCLLGNAGEKDLMTAGKVLRPVIAHLRKYEDELTAGEYLILLSWYSEFFNSNIVKPDSVLVERYAKLIIESKGRSFDGDAEDKGAAYMILGMMNLKGAEEPEKAKAAFEYFQKEKAVYDKDGSADFLLGKCYDEGIGVEADPQRAMEYYENAAGKGNAAAQFALALRLLGDEDESNVERGKILLKLAAEGGDSDAEHLYGLWLIRGVYFNKNVEEGMKWLEKAAVSDNDADAMNSLGEQYRDGIDGVEIDYEKAFKWFEKGAVGGSTAAMQSLGWAYLNGQGIPRDCNAARKWFVKAAKTGNASAECTLGTRLCCGDFGDRDVCEAIKWWERAAEHGDTVAMRNLGSTYRDGDGVEKDLHKAEEWYVRAAEAGDGDAACTLGAAYYRGGLGEPVQLDQVDFSALAPRAMKAGACSTIQIVMYEKDFRNEVDAIIKGAEGPVHETRSGQVMAPRGAKIRIVLLSQDIEIDDNVEEGNWSGGYRVFSFLVQLPVDFVKSQVRFAATVYIQDVVATKLKFMASCSGKGNSRPSVQRKDVNSAFISYASKDRPCVINAIQGMLKVRPDLDVFLDVAKLHSGEDWESRLYKEIDDRDVLYLFWSRHAKKSKWVGREWRYAFHTKGIEGIEPFPIESAETCPPPKELSKLHFNDYLQCLAQGMASAHGS